MKFVIDTHCHTISSGHAYSTVLEIAREANNKGLEMIGITDHGPEMPGGPHIFHIGNLKVIPEKIYGVEILRGVEANIIDYNGKLDVPDEVLEKLDIVLAGLHPPCIDPGSIEENTNAILNAMENDYVDVIVHPGNPVFPIDKERFVLKAKETNTLVEINNSSFSVSREGSRENCIEIAQLCKKYGVKVVVGSDSHVAFDVGKFDKVLSIFRDIDMPEELIMNLNVERFKNYLKSKKKIRFLETTDTSKM
ncbi:phosphatase [Thermohalobacter berrensis]|uniref:Phosphatase n=1 Tax=Thermohalobacter berrensis TaxID=99594 RepID=A0A419SY49_9FIRM|nr:phosphatase [Thermohalobacter berrensis]RKD30111.1 phosphatase [Thermohalobacter berrensis]